MIPDIPPNYPPARPDLKAFRPPKSQSKIAYWVWRVHMWIEGTFSLAMLEPWEKLLLLIIFLTTFTLLATGIVRYLPHHISVMKGRAVYYLWGSESGESSVFQWLGKTAGSNGGNSGIPMGEL
ncbi:hypothetical protein EV368DRAFT_47532 [Lentinula lateritia]|uniref:Uncharacterized protein n=1 Tax=Lentinula aff. lateritia TaxID=2804960 RepID=A0ACC1U3Z4_9AGAR|nr:hypothetical protein F5876DRAFT_39673 [Lentinula aff. lateritia]KAJ3849327.1 hypothetical protein EV368DRAFT_47532 [Lentinula lateritia]